MRTNPTSREAMRQTWKNHAEWIFPGPPSDDYIPEDKSDSRKGYIHLKGGSVDPMI
jgi:hypothetical protein